MPAGDATAKTTPTTMALPPPPLARYAPEPGPAPDPTAPPVGVPIDLGPPLAAWHADALGAPSAERRPSPPVLDKQVGPVVGAPGAPPRVEPVRDDRPPPPRSPETPPPPAKEPPQGPLAGKGKPRSGSGGLTKTFDGGPAADLPVRGPAAAILMWRHGHLRHQGRQLRPGRKVPTGTTRFGDQVGRARGLAVEPAGAASASY